MRAAFSVGLSGEVLLVDADAQRSETIQENLAHLEAQFREGFSPLKACGLTAVACYNDLHAIAAQRALAGFGLRVPQDISLTGFDDSWSVFGTPPITTVSHMLFEIGQRAGQTAIERFQAHRGLAAPPPSSVIEPSIVVRSSTGLAPA